jgi:hypothetical protein
MPSAVTLNLMTTYSLSWRRLLTVALGFMFLSPFTNHSADQPSGCTAVIPMTVILGDGRSVTPLTSDALEIRIHGRLATIAALDQDSAPKRVVLVLDASKEVNGEAWKIETSLATFLAKGAPPQVALALVVLNAEARTLDFTTPRETLKSELADLASARPTNAKRVDNIYAGLLSSLGLFGTRQFGDAIFVFAGGSDDSGRIDAGEVQRKFIDQGVRLFGFVLGPRSLSGFYKLKPGGTVQELTPLDPDTDEIGHLAIATGGSLAVENTRMPNVTYHLSDDRLKQLQATAYRLYTHSVMPYRVQFSTNASENPENLSMELTKAFQVKVPNAKALFPRQIAPCALPGAR